MLNRITVFLLAAFAMSFAATLPVSADTPVASNDGVIGTECNPGMSASVGDFLLASSGTPTRQQSTPTQTPHQGPSNMAAPGGSGGNTASIPKGGCCGPVLGGCVSWCNKSGGCTGKGDCDTFKSNN